MKKNSAYILAQKLSKRNFIFPERHTDLLYIYVREWLEKQDVFIHITRAATIEPKYMYKIDLGTRKHISTMGEAASTSKEAVENAVLKILDMDIFPKS